MLTIVFYLILLITISEAIAQYCLRCARDKVVNEHCNLQSCFYLIFFGIISYCMVALLLFKVYSYESLGLTNLIWSCTSIVVAFIVGKILFQEEITKSSLFAIIFAMLAIYFANQNHPEIHY